MKFVKKVSVIAFAAALASQATYADKRENVQAVKGGISFTAGTIIGAIAGGPFGALLGALGGVYVSEEGRRADENELALEQSNITLAQLESEINMQEQEISSLEQMIEEKMQFKMHFNTGEKQLSAEDQERVNLISEFLRENSSMHVVIDGHTDIRGSDEYNLTLSEERANTVVKILTNSGVEDYRINAKGHGSNFANTQPANAEDYAQDRKVNIQIFSSKGSAELATID